MLTLGPGGSSPPPPEGLETAEFLSQPLRRALPLSPISQCQLGARRGWCPGGETGLTSSARWVQCETTEGRVPHPGALKGLPLAGHSPGAHGIWMSNPGPHVRGSVCSCGHTRGHHGDLRSRTQTWSKEDVCQVQSEPQRKETRRLKCWGQACRFKQDIRAKVTWKVGKACGCPEQEGLPRVSGALGASGGAAGAGGPWGGVGAGGQWGGVGAGCRRMIHGCRHLRAIGGDAASGPGRHSESLETGKGPRLTFLLWQRRASPAPAAVKALVWLRSRVSVLAILGLPPVF